MLLRTIVQSIQSARESHLHYQCRSAARRTFRRKRVRWRRRIFHVVGDLIRRRGLLLDGIVDTSYYVGQIHNAFGD
jgi:hypothetical protein